MSDSARKRTLADWVVKTKKQVIKLYAVVKWARDADTVQKCMVRLPVFLPRNLCNELNILVKNITAFLMNQNQQFEDAMVGLNYAKTSLDPARFVDIASGNTVCFDAQDGQTTQPRSTHLFGRFDDWLIPEASYGHPGLVTLLYHFTTTHRGISENDHHANTSVRPRGCKGAHRHGECHPVPITNDGDCPGRNVSVPHWYYCTILTVQ